MESQQNTDDVKEKIEVLDDMEDKAAFKFADYIKEKYGLGFTAATDIMYGGYTLEEALAEYKGK